MELSDEKIWIYGLYVACPEGKPLLDCPLERYRSLPDTKKIAIVENLSQNEVKEIFKHHNQCLLHRV
jgi:hypothetical protein